MIYINEEIMKKAGFGKEVELVKQKICPFCKKPVDESKLRREIDRKEFKISGMCQDCQDTTF